MNLWKSGGGVCRSSRNPRCLNQLKSKGGNIFGSNWNQLVKSTRWDVPLPPKSKTSKPIEIKLYKFILSPNHFCQNQPKSISWSLFGGVCRSSLNLRCQNQLKSMCGNLYGPKIHCETAFSIRIAIQSASSPTVGFDTTEIGLATWYLHTGTRQLSRLSHVMALKGYAGKSDNSGVC